MTSSTSPGGNTLASNPTDTRSDKRRSAPVFRHPNCGMRQRYAGSPSN